MIDTHHHRWPFLNTHQTKAAAQPCQYHHEAFCLLDILSYPTNCDSSSFLITALVRASTIHPRRVLLAYYSLAKTDTNAVQTTIRNVELMRQPEGGSKDLEEGASFALREETFLDMWSFHLFVMPPPLALLRGLELNAVQLEEVAKS